MADIEHGVTVAPKVASLVAYATSGTLLVGDALQWLNENAGAVGALCAIATMGINWYYQRRPRR